MKTISLVVEDDIFDELNNLMEHKGQRSFLLRKKVVQLIRELKEIRKIEESSCNRTQDGTHSFSG